MHTIPAPVQASLSGEAAHLARELVRVGDGHCSDRFRGNTALKKLTRFHHRHPSALHRDVSPKETIRSAEVRLHKLSPTTVENLKYE